MAERKSTGGMKEFSYSKEELSRIRSTDTASTRAFKEAYSDWQTRRAEEKIEEELRSQRMKLLLIAMGLTIAAVALIIIAIIT
jgi:hypothetical protein